MADREKKRKKISIKNVVACGIGTALFVVLTEVQIPIGIPNTSLQPRMAVLAFLSAIFGPATGAVIGLLGHALGDALSTDRSGGAGCFRKPLSESQLAHLPESSL